jgi:hypothetical protein
MKIINTREWTCLEVYKAFLFGLFSKILLILAIIFFYVLMYVFIYFLAFF